MMESQVIYHVGGEKRGLEGLSVVVVTRMDGMDGGGCLSLKDVKERKKILFFRSGS
jgi:signal recognition particle GTPase